MQTETTDVTYLRLAALAYGAGSVEEKKRVASIIRDWCRDQSECIRMARGDLAAGDVGAAAEIIGTARRWTFKP